MGGTGCFSARIHGMVVTMTIVAMVGGCAEVITRSSIEIVPRTNTTPVLLGPPHGQVSAQSVELEWTQDGDRLSVQISERRTCTSVRHIPVVRIERVDRKTVAGAMWIEYGLGAAALAVGLTGLIKPEIFSQQTTTVAGQSMEETKTGYRFGGVFTGIGAVLLTAAVVDTLRTRDEVIFTDAYRRQLGGTVECQDPLVPFDHRTVELVVDQWSTSEPTDARGTVRWLLPPIQELPEAAQRVIEATARWEEEHASAQGESEVSPVSPRPSPLRVKGLVRVAPNHTVAVDFMVPYDVDGATAHQGHTQVELTPVRVPPLRPSSSSSVGDEDIDPS